MQNFNIRQNLDFFITILVAVAAFSFVIYYNINNPHITVRYDCSISEISPDYPPQVKEGCRKLRAENVLKDLQKPK